MGEPEKRPSTKGMALVVRRVDRVVLHPFVSRAGNVAFLGGIVAGVVQWAMGVGVVTVLTAVLFAVGVVLMAAPPLRRWWRARHALPLAEGDEVASPLSKPEAPTGVLADIQHLDGCPHDTTRMETWAKTREQDGIEVTVGKCHDCGVMAYRHGDRATLGDPSPEREEWKPEARSPIERLRAALSEAIDLRAEINEAEPSQWSYGRNDPLLSWARDTWELIREHFTEYADEFWGPELTGLRSDYFATAYSLECRDLNRDGRSGYLERRIYLLKRIAREPGR